MKLTSVQLSQAIAHLNAVNFLEQSFWSPDYSVRVLKRYISALG